MSFILTTLAGGAMGVFAAMTMNRWLGYAGNQALVNGMMMSYSLAKYYFGNLGDIQPSAVVAGIPMPSVQELSHGISDTEVKYRANGGVFLAHQDGGRESLRIVGKAWGENRFVFLNMLDFLFLYGSSTRLDLWNEAVKSGLPFQPIGQTLLQPGVTIETGVNPWEEFDLKNISEGYHDRHMTFPIITKNRIYLSMYIETYSWRQSIDRTGMKQIEYTIFFRKYDPEPKFQFKKVIIPKKEGGYRYMTLFKESDVIHPIYKSMYKAAAEIFPTLVINMANEMTNSEIFAGNFSRNEQGLPNATDESPSKLIKEDYF